MTTPTEAMLALGEFRFSLKTIPFDLIKEVSSYRWEEQHLFGKGSQLQYTGYDAPQITISGVSFLQGNKSLELIQKLKEEAKKGKPMLLVDSYGKVHGKWVLTEIEDTKSLFFHEGTPRKMEFSITLKFYG